MVGIHSKRRKPPPPPPPCEENHVIEIQSKRQPQPYKENHVPNNFMEIQSKRQPYIGNHVPHDLIETILFRLPVKSLLRFKAVCKQWNATISDQKFAETHLRQSKSSCNLLFAMKIHSFKNDSDKSTKIVEIEDGELRVLSAVYDNPQEKWLQSRVLCHGDGLYLVPHLYRQRCYVVFNPSNRTFKVIRYPYLHIDANRGQRRFGICYDPLVKDYRVVIGDRKHYAIFYCKTESWSSRKNINDVSSSVFNPSFYWVFYTSGMANPRSKVEVLGFDARDGKFGHVMVPDATVELICPMSMCLEGFLCLLPSFNTMKSLRNKIIPIWNRQVGDEWTRLHLKSPWSYLRPLCWTYRNKIIICEVGLMKTRARDCSILYYDVAERRLTRVRNRSNLKNFRLVPYVENMFML